MRIRPFSMNQAMGEASRLFGRRAGFYIGLILLMTIPESIIGFADDGAILAIAVAVFLGAFTEAAITITALRDARGEPAAGNIVAAALGYYGPVLVATLVAVVLLTIGLLLFIIPGVVVLSLFFFAVPVIVAERGSGIRGLERSLSLGRGNRLEIFLMVFLYLLVLLGGALALEALFVRAPGLGAVFSWLLTGVVGAYGSVLALSGYLQLCEIEAEATPAAEEAG